MMPAQQGELDGLCGLYAIVNAVGELWPEMSDERRQRLATFICDTIGDHKVAKMRRDGASILLLQMMLNAAVLFSRKQLRDTLKFSAPYLGYRGVIRVHHWWDEVAEKAGGTDAVAIIGLMRANGEPYEHWTCLSEINVNRAVLKDSTGLKEIRFSDLGFEGDGKPTEVSWHQVFILERVP